MSLAPGSRIGHYEIVAPIGAGGMGEVYRAKDTKLGRDVALKILPGIFARDPERMARFEREARLLASLDHPNIAPIFGLEDSGGTRAIVMALIEGPTLAERIAQGPLPPGEARLVALQIAEAFEYAHDRGVIHRDLKPANIKITPDGPHGTTVKVLDFGLAKALDDELPSGASPANSPTLAATVSMGATQPGMILGTAAYISPEQVKGKKADRRSDIWSFGVVLHEMLTGKQPFTGDSVGEILASVIKEEPKFDAIPLEFRTLVVRCLAKDPRKRVQSFGEARLMLEEPVAPASAGVTAVVESQLTKPGSKSGTTKVAWSAAGVLALALPLALWAPWNTEKASDKPLIRLDVDLGPDVNLDYRSGTSVIISPDGSRLAFISQGKLFTRALDQPIAKELVGSEGVTSPFFSPDGQWIGYFSQGKMKKVSVAGGTPIDLAPSSASFTGAAWGTDGNIIAPLAAGSPLQRIPEAGGIPAPIMELDAAAKEVTQRWPQLLPGGKAILFVSHTAPSGFDGANVDAVTLPDGRRKTLLRGATFGRYLPTYGNTGHLVYVNRGTLFAVLCDPGKLETRGTPTPVIDPLGYSSGFGFAEFSASQAGTVVERSEGENFSASPQWLDASGRAQPLISKRGTYVQVRFSPDGARLALTMSDDTSPISLWSYDWTRDTMTRLTFDANNPSWPAWTPDGRFVFYSAPGSGLFATRSDGAGTPTRVLSIQPGETQSPGSFSPNGKLFIFSKNDLGRGNRSDLWTMQIDFSGPAPKAGKPELFLQTSANETTPTFSPDGKWIAYVSDEAGISQVYVRSFPDKGGKWLISSGTGLLPVWSRNGHELFFRTLDDQVMVANYTTRGDSFIAEKPRVWTERRLAPLGVNRNWDLAPDGKRIVALLPTSDDVTRKRQSQVIYLENFFDELRRKVPKK